MTELTKESSPLKVVNLDRTVAFFCDSLEMEIVQQQFEKGLCVLLEKGDGTQISLSERKNHEPSTRLQLTTKDCIAQYCQLKSRGIVFTKTPTYISDGLMAEFIGPCGNHYMLFEMRKYDE